MYVCPVLFGVCLCVHVHICELCINIYTYIYTYDYILYFNMLISMSSISWGGGCTVQKLLCGNENKGLQRGLGIYVRTLNCTDIY